MHLRRLPLMLLISTSLYSMDSIEMVELPALDAEQKNSVNARIVLQTMLRDKRSTIASVGKKAAILNHLEQSQECPICKEEKTEPELTVSSTDTSCFHVLCKVCKAGWQKKTCPECRHPFDNEDLQLPARTPDTNAPPSIPMFTLLSRSSTSTLLYGPSRTRVIAVPQPPQPLAMSDDQRQQRELINRMKHSAHCGQRLICCFHNLLSPFYSYVVDVDTTTFLRICCYTTREHLSCNPGSYHLGCPPPKKSEYQWRDITIQGMYDNYPTIMW